MSVCLCSLVAEQLVSCRIALLDMEWTKSNQGVPPHRAPFVLSFESRQSDKRHVECNQGIEAGVEHAGSTPAARRSPLLLSYPHRMDQWWLPPAPLIPLLISCKHTWSPKYSSYSGKTGVRTAPQLHLYFVVQSLRRKLVTCLVALGSRVL